MLSFDPFILQANSVVEGNFFSGYETFFSNGIINNVAGTIANVYGLVVGQGNVSEPGMLVSISFSAVSGGTSSIDFTSAGITNETMYLPVNLFGGNVTVESVAYHYWYAPENSFGISSTKTVNWSYFKQLFLAHTDWMLEYKRYDYSDWTDGSDYLTIERTWNESGFWKFNLIFDVPVNIYSARFTFGIDLPCLQYVERSDYEIWINYTANATETYSCMFNWSDIASIPNLVITKGTQDGMFWFRFRRDDIPAGHYEFDPSFGYSEYGYDTVSIEDCIHGGLFQISEDGTADNITVYLEETGFGDGIIKCALYDSDKQFIAETEERTPGCCPWNQWTTFNFSEPKPGLTKDASYYIVAWGDDTDGDFVIHYDWAAYSSYYDDETYNNFPDLLIPVIATDVGLCIYCNYATEAPPNNPPTQSAQKIWDSTTSTEKALNATGVVLTPTCFNVTVNDTDADQMNVTVMTNESGAWLVANQTASGMTNGTYHAYNTSWVDSYSTTYYISFNVSDDSDWCNETYHFTTEAEPDTTPPTITINFAGNLSDSGGPYWRPPGESTQLTGDWSDGYYTNDSRQSEGWMYINLTVEDSGGVPNVWLQWNNESTWTNYTYAFLNTTGGYFEFNTSGNISTAEGYNYSFNIVANDTNGNSKNVWWNKTGISGSETRRYVQLNCTTTNISYSPLYMYNAVYNVLAGTNRKDRLHHDQGYDGSNTDTGFLESVEPIGTVDNIYCDGWLGLYYEDSMCVEPFTLNNIYFHIWWSTDTSELYRTGWRKNREEPDPTIPADLYTPTTGESHSNISYDGGTPNDIYFLDASLLLVTPTKFTDNDIYELMIVFMDGSDYPSIISNRSFTSFVLFNIPDNTTLNASHADTDSDGLSDWTELYVNYTNPFLADTDNDGVSDYDETLSGSDPNNYTDTIEYKQWVTLDTWNITLSNTTMSYTLDTWNITLSNTPQAYILDTWNLTLGNLTITPFTIDTWNVTLCNLTISSYVLDTWNVTLSNTPEANILDTWNITLSNTSQSYILDTWNITLSNTSSHAILEPSFETVTNWIYYENESGCYGEQSSSGVTDGSKSYGLAVQNNVGTGYCKVYQTYINLTDINNIYADLFLNSDVAIDVPAYVSLRVNDDILYERKIGQTETILIRNVSIDVSAYGDYCTLEYRLNQTDVGIYDEGIFAYIDNIRTKIWHTLDTWNITLGNMSINPYVLDTWNITLSNTPQPYTLDTWNLTLSNLTISPYILDTWNLTLGNLTITPYILDTWNLTLSNTPQPHILDTWNLTLSNLTISSYILDTWNLTLGNLSISQFTIDTWNITLSNLTISPYILDTWNITLSNTTVGEILDTWNITLGNLTITPFTLDTWNITLSNTPQPYILDTWNLTLSNTSVGEILDRWNITLSNTSFFLITDVKATPSEAVINDVDINITCNVTSLYAIVNVTVNMTEGIYDMANIGDLYYYVAINSTIGTHYYHIYANDTSGDQLESATYSFRIIGLSCSFTYTVNGGLMTLTPTITGATHYQWTFVNETGVKGQTLWIPIEDIGSYIQGYVYPTTIRVYLSAKNINFNQFANYSDVVRIYKSSFEKPEPIIEEPTPEPSNVFKETADAVGKWFGERNTGEILFMIVMAIIISLFVIKKKYPPKKIIYQILKKKKKKEKERTPHEILIERIDRLEGFVFK